MMKLSSIRFIFNQEKKESDIQTRKEIGMCNDKLIRFKRSLYLSQKQSLITDLKVNFETYLKIIILYKHNFKTITKERYNEIKDYSKNWLSNQNIFIIH